MNKLNWFFLSRLYKTNAALELMLLKCMDSGVKSATPNGYYMVVKFYNGYTMNAWNANLYYAWLSNGKIETSEGVFVWENSMPSKKTMRLLYNELVK